MPKIKSSIIKKKTNQTKNKEHICPSCRVFLSCLVLKWQALVLPVKDFETTQVWAALTWLAAFTGIFYSSNNFLEVQNENKKL